MSSNCQLSFSNQSIFTTSPRYTSILFCHRRKHWASRTSISLRLSLFKKTDRSYHNNSLSRQKEMKMFSLEQLWQSQKSPLQILLLIPSHLSKVPVNKETAQDKLRVTKKNWHAPFPNQTTSKDQAWIGHKMVEVCYRHLRECSWWD